MAAAEFTRGRWVYRLWPDQIKLEKAGMVVSHMESPWHLTTRGPCHLRGTSSLHLQTLLGSCLIHITSYALFC